MSEAARKGPKKTEKSQKKSWFKGLKAEFKKIMWPDRKTVGKQTVAVVLTSIALGLSLRFWTLSCPTESCADQFIGVRVWQRQAGM